MANFWEKIGVATCRRARAFFGALLMCGVFLVPSTSFAENPACETVLKYTSCVSGRYLKYNGSCDSSSPHVGNECASCPSGCNCAGGTACPVCQTTVTITFRAKNNTMTQTCTSGQSVTLKSRNYMSSPVFTTYGWSFYGWATTTSSAEVEYDDGETITCPNSDTTLYGVWSRDIDFVYYDGSNAVSTTTGTRTQYYFNTSATAAMAGVVRTYALSTQSSYGWQPMGWILDDSNYGGILDVSGSSEQNVTPAENSSDTVYWAIYERRPQIVYNKNGGNGTMSNSYCDDKQQIIAGGTAMGEDGMSEADCTLADGDGFTPPSNSVFSAWAAGSTSGTQYDEGDIIHYPNKSWTGSQTYDVYAIWVTTTVHCDAGYYLNASGTCTTCGNGYWCPGGDYTPNGSIQGRNDCPTRTDSNWTVYTTSTTASSWSACYETRTPSGCSSGTIKRAASSSSAYSSTTTVESALSANSNYYVDGTSCPACSSQDSGTYPYSVGGAIGYGYCYRACVASDVTGATAVASGGKRYSDNSGNTCAASSCATNRYLSSGSCPTCTSKNSTYPLSDGGSNGYTYCYRELTNTGSQVEPSLPTGCASQTTSACTPGTCTYRDYNGATDTTCTPTDCTKTRTGLSANANRYVNGTTSCPTCTSKNSTYTLSDGGNIDYTYCYRELTNTGSQLEPSLPTGCLSQTTSACTPGTCTYRDYNGATDTTCTPTDCTKTRTGLSANANRYVNGTTSCPACSSQDDGEFPYSTGGTNGYAYCYRDCVASDVTGATAVASGGKRYSDNSGNTCAASSCAANRYLSSGSCPTCASNSSAYPNSAAGSTANTNCYANVTLYKNGYNGSISNGTGCEVETNSGTTNAILHYHYNTACTLPSVSATQSPYVFNGFSTAATIAGGTTVSSLTKRTSAPAYTSLYVRKTGCAANTFKSDNNTCTACGAHSTTSANNTSTTCTCDTGYTADGTAGGATTSTSGCSPIAYTVTVNASSGISTVAGTDWTGTGTASMNKVYHYGDTITFSSVVTPTQKTGYTGAAYYNGTTAVTSLTVTGDATITVKATGLTTPTATISAPSTNTTKTYNQSATTVTATSQSSSYDSNTVTVYYKFGYSSTSSGTYTYGDAQTSNSISVAADSHYGYRYYKVQVYAVGEGGITSSTKTSAASKYIYLLNRQLTFNANGGTLSGTSPLFTSYNGTKLYTSATAATEVSASNLPTATKNSSVLLGWYNKSGSSKVVTTAGAPTGTVSGYTSDSKFVMTDNKTVYAKYGTCTCTKGTKVNTCTVTGVTNNKCQYSFTCVTGYEHSTGTFEGAEATATNTSPACTAKTITITLSKNSGTGTIRNNAGTNFTGSTSATMTCTADATNVALPTWVSSVSTTNNKTDITRSQKTFQGWSTNSSAATGSTSITCPTSDTTYYAAWTTCSCGTDSNATCAVQATSNNTCQYKHTCTTGYYNTNNGVNVSSNTMTCSECGSGKYCPSGAKSPSNCSSLGGGLFTSTDTTTASVNTQCYATTTAGKWIETSQDTALKNCTAGSYCPGNVKVYYTLAPGGSIVACAAPYSNSAAGSDDENDCYLTLTAGQYVPTAGGGASVCGADTWSDSTSDIYYGGSVSGRSTTSSCTSCARGYTTSGTAASNHDAKSDCTISITLKKNGSNGTIQGTGGTNDASVTCQEGVACDFGSASSLVPTAGGYTMAGGWGTSSTCTSTTTSFTTPTTTTYYACKNSCSYTNSTAAVPSSNVCAGTCDTGYSTSGGSNTGTAASCSGTTCTCSPKTFTVTLNDNTGSGGSGTIYTTYNTNVYKDSGRSNAMTSSAYPVTKPSKSNGYKFLGYYNSTSGSTQYIDENGYITSAGLSAGKALTANGTWYARYESMSVAIPMAVSHTYDGTAKSCAGVFEFEEGQEDIEDSATITYSETSGGTYTSTVPTITNPGEKTIYFKVSAPGYTDYYEYYWCTMNRLTLTPASGTITYPTTTTTFTAACASGGPVTVSSRNTGVATVSKSSTPTNGAYTVTVTWVAAGSGNNNASTVIDVNCTEQYESEGDEEIESIYAPVSGTYSVTTAKGNGSTTLSSSSSTLTYNGTSAASTTNTFTAKCADGVKPTATSSNTNAATVAVSSSADANGNYTITNTWVGAGSGDNNATSTITVSCAAGTHYKSSSATHTLTTAKKANTLTLSASSGTVTYPEASKTFTVSTNTSSGTLNVTSGTTTVATASLSGTTVTMTPKKSGTSTITVTSAATDYYKSATATYNLTVADKTITINKNNGTGTCGGATGTTAGSMTCTYAANTCTAPTWNSTSCSITNGSGSSAKVFIGWDSSSSATTATYAGGTNVKNATSPLYAIWKAPTCSKGTGVNTTSLNSVSNNAPVCNRSSTDGYYCSATQTGTAGSLNVNVTCTAASDGYFAKAGATAQTACAVGSYSTASSASSTCTVCPAGKTTSGTSTHYNANANTACATTCSNASGVTQWLTPRWESNNTVISLCAWGCHAVTMQEPSGNFTDNNYVPQTVYFINEGYNGYSYWNWDSDVPVYADSACSVPLNATDLTIYDHLLPGVEISGVANNYICSSGTYGDTYGSFVTSNPLTLSNYSCTSEAIENGWVLRYTTSCTNGYEYDENLEACEGYKQSEELYPNEGTGGSSTLYFKYGTGAYLDEDYTMLMSTSANPITIPTRTGYHFDGYYLQGEYSNSDWEYFGYWDEEEEPQIINENGYITSDGIEFAQNFFMNSGMSIYARWTANTNTITLNGNSASGGKIRNTAMTSGAVTFTCTTDSSITLPTWSATDSATTTSIYKGKKRFLGWATSSTATAAETITTCPTGAQTYYAVWSADCTCGTDSNATCAVQNTSNNTCQYKHTCTTGYYHASNGATITNSSLTCTVCPAGSFCPAGATESTLCAAGSYTDTTGQSACTACQNGVTNAGTSASTQQSCGTTCSNAANARTDNNSLTWQTATWTNNSVTNACTLKNTGCKGTYYYNNNNCTACPNATTYKRTTFPENYYATQIDSTSVQNTAGVTAITGCKVLSWISGPRGDLYEYALYNSTTSKYDNTQSYNWRSATAGYYLTDKNGSATTCSSNYRYYHTNSPCPAGSYCPGVPKQACTSANPLPYTATLGLNDCATDTTNYPDSAALSSMIGQCYLTTTSTKYVAEAGAGEVTCACGGYCPGGTVVYYNSDGGTTTGGRTACGSGKYNASTGSSASSACSTAGAGYYANSSCGQTAVNAGYYSSGGGTSATPTAAGNGCLSGNTCGSVSAGYYSSGGGTSATPTAAGNGCISGKSCGKVSAGYYSTGGGTSATPTAAGNGCISTKECGFIAAGYYGGTGATTSSGTAAVNGGYYSTGGGTSATPTANGNGCVGTGNTCGKLAAAYYCAGGAKVAAPSSTSDSVTGAACGTCNSNYRANTATGKTAVTQCQINCADGKYVASQNGTCSGTCAAGSFKASHNVNYGSTSSCAVCAANNWSDAGAGSCTACTTAKGYGNSGGNVTDHATIASCKVTCPGGQYVAAQAGGCVNVGAGNWCAGGTVAENATLSRTACSTGLTTIGYGAGADEAGDCGHKFHAGDGILYLRSTKKTNPSLNVKVGSTTFYGNMSTSSKNMSDGTTKKLKVKNNGTTYWVHDDSVN